MEIVIVVAILACLLFGSLTSLGWVSVLALVILLVVGYRAYRVRCKSCGNRVITGRGLRFCGQCGAKQSPHGFHFRCDVCRGLSRSEINIRFCNTCGTPVTDNFKDEDAASGQDSLPG